MAESDRTSRAERGMPRINGSLIVGMLVGFVLGAIAGGLMVEELIDNRNEATKPFVGEPALEPEAVREHAPGPGPGAE